MTRNNPITSRSACSCKDIVAASDPLWAFMDENGRNAAIQQFHFDRFDALPPKVKKAAHNALHNYCPISFEWAMNKYGEARVVQLIHSKLQAARDAVTSKAETLEILSLLQPQSTQRIAR